MNRKMEILSFESGEYDGSFQLLTAVDIVSQYINNTII